MTLHPSTPPGVELDDAHDDGITRLHIAGYGTVYGDGAAVREIERRLTEEFQHGRAVFRENERLREDLLTLDGCWRNSTLRELNAAFERVRYGKPADKVTANAEAADD